MKHSDLPHDGDLLVIVALAFAAGVVAGVALAVVGFVVAVLV